MKWSLGALHFTMLLGYAINLSAQTSDNKVVQDGNKVSLAVTGGWDFATFRFKDLAIPSPTGDNSDPGYQLGLAAEFMIFKDRNWSIMFQPTYQASSGSNPDRHHQSIELPLGVRRYFPLKSVDLFLDALVVPDLPIRYEATTTDPAQPEAKVTSGLGMCAALGGGARVKRFSLEGRYYTVRSYTKVYVAQYTKFSIILGVRLTK